jgi:hypothetical protein
MGLPWVIERPATVGAPYVRTFAVDCVPIHRHQLWLVSGLASGLGVAVVIPAALAADFEAAGLSRTIAPMPAAHVLAAVSDQASPTDVERVLLEAYACAMS